MSKKRKIALVALAALVTLGSLATVEETTRETIYYSEKQLVNIKAKSLVIYEDGKTYYKVPDESYFLDGPYSYKTAVQYVIKSKKGPGIITKTISELSENASKLIRRK